MGKRTTEQLMRANQQRNYLKALSRKACFIAEYIEIKYSGIYNEALQFFEALNTTHPTKPNLRKAKEFRAWKGAMKGEETKKRRKQTYSYVQNAPEPESPHPQPSDESESPWPQPSDESESPWPQPSEEPESPYSQSADNPATPQSDDEPESPYSQSADKPGTPQLQAAGEPENPRAPFETSPTRYNDNMVLRIPLLKSPQTSPPAVTTETIQIVTEQTLEPLTLDDIPPERIEQLITELQQDPDIMGMFTDIEAQLEFEQLGLDIDISESYSLEDELADW